VNQPDYFSNHAVKLRFPWRLYHGPIVDCLSQAVRQSPGAEALNIGSGPFFELETIDARGLRFTICDIEPRAIELAKQLYGDKLAGADVVAPDAPLPYADARFDLVVSMDVIEHVSDPLAWVREALRVLKPGGTLFLTTPNYASLSLRVIESTALEAVARFQGFSRKHIHPTKMTPDRLRNVLLEAGCREPRIETISLGWVLSAHCQK
jgi:2-polyprenyl-6-hydroxyphenyl methylase/3-demethylubiquinone-9 3-methyltransferase